MTGQKLNLTSAEDAHAFITERAPSHVKVGFFDIDGVFRGKFIGREKFLSALRSGYGFCNAVLGWDVANNLYNNAAYTGWHSGFPDANLRILIRQAHGRKYICENRQEHNGRFTQAFGLYQDEYRRVDGRWWIARRFYTSLARTGDDLTTFPFPDSPFAS